jgi:selenocysteine lyase/cysteine desulfurase
MTTAVRLQAPKALFSEFLGADPARLHFAAHSHHLWPDVTRAAQMEAWTDAAQGVDHKWDRVFGEVLPEARGHLARQLGGVDPADFCFAPNVHELLVRLVSAIERKGPVRILASGSEFHSFTRQARRWVEAGQAQLELIPSEPFESFPARFAAAIRRGGHDLIWSSHVLFDSGYVFEQVFELLANAPAEALVCVDGYHGFMALPTDLAPYAARLFYTAGSYKYAMAGEGVCFLHAPKGLALRPVNTGWFAGFGALESGVGERVAYSADAGRLMGATFDPSGLYRFNAVQRLLAAEDWSVARIHAHVAALQSELLERLAGAHHPLGLGPEQLLPGPEARERGHFLTFRRADAQALKGRLDQLGIVVDARGDRLRFGLGLYHSSSDLERLVSRLERAGRE